MVPYRLDGRGVPVLCTPSVRPHSSSYILQDYRIYSNTSSNSTYLAGAVDSGVPRVYRRSTVDKSLWFPLSNFESFSARPPQSNQLIIHVEPSRRLPRAFRETRAFFFFFSESMYGVLLLSYVLRALQIQYYNTTISAELSMTASSRHQFHGSSVLFFLIGIE